MWVQLKKPLMNTKPSPSNLTEYFGENTEWNISIYKSKADKEILKNISIWNYKDSFNSGRWTPTIFIGNMIWKLWMHSTSRWSVRTSRWDTPKFAVAMRQNVKELNPFVRRCIPPEGAFVRVKATLTPAGWKVFAAGARFGTQEVQLCLPEPGPGTKPAFPLTCYV